MRLVVKLGGEVVSGDALGPIAADIAALAAAGDEVVVVHGGGPQATKLQEALGQTPKKIAGRRVTDAATLDVMKMVVAGKLNVDLCAGLLAAGARPIGLHGASGLAIEATRRPPTVFASVGPDPVDLGLVGDVVRVNVSLLEVLWRERYLPVIACLGASATGDVFNINADTVANQVAVGLSADALLLVSDVPGVLRDVKDPASRIPRITADEGQQLVASGAITAGMIPKIDEAFAALKAGVRRVHVLGKLRRGDLANEARSPGSVGTTLVAS